MLDALLARFSGADAPPCLVAAGCETRLGADLDVVARNPLAVTAMEARAEAGDDFWGEGPTDWRTYFRPYVVKDGVLQVPVKGALLASCSIAYGSYVTGYGYIGRAFERGLADANVRGIAFLLDTYGGQVAENFDLVDKVFAARGTKPVRAFAHEHAYSAGYSLASAADRIVISRTGGVGSIGVVTSHRDASAAMERMGVKYTFVFAGKHKVDGNAFEALPDDVKARMQARIDELYAVFTASVARNRGMTDEAVRATEALTYTAAAAVEAGLADEIGSLDDAVSAFAASLNSDTQDEQMTALTQEALDAAVATARTESATAAAARVTAILADDRSKGRERAALQLAAASPAMSTEDVLAYVAEHAAAPAPAGASAGSRLDALMTDSKVDADAAGGAEADVDPWAATVARTNAAAKAGRL